MKYALAKIARRILGCCWVLALVANQSLLAAVTIETSDGRVLSGKVDPLTDEHQLWIRQQSEQILLTTAVPWPLVTSATQNGERLPLENLAEILSRSTSGEPLGFLATRLLGPELIEARQPWARNVVTTPSNRPRPASIRSLQADAVLVNLDRDVEPEGLEIVVSALDEFGVPMPVRGNLSVRLWGERLQPRSRRIDSEEIQRWTHPVVQNDFVDGIARYAFRFRTVDPALDATLGPEALVNVRLGVFGQGNFETSVPVLIRQFFPFRERLRQRTDQRFLNEEWIGRAPRHQPTSVRARRLLFSH